MAADGVSTRPRRADAVRNYDALVVAATEIFLTEGTDASLESIARKAGVGIGTLYRRFPTRHTLVEAVYRREVELLCSGVDELLAQGDPAAALATWMQRFVGHVATKRGLATVLKEAAGKDSELFAHAHQLLVTATGDLLAAGVAAGQIRADVAPMELLRAISGICLATDASGRDGQAERLVGLLLDGLRYGAGDGARRPARAKASGTKPARRRS